METVTWKTTKIFVRSNIKASKEIIDTEQDESGKYIPVLDPDYQFLSEFVTREFQRRVIEDMNKLSFAAFMKSS